MRFFHASSRILNPHLLNLLARVRHTNTVVIADSMFPSWPGLIEVDLSWSMESLRFPGAFCDPGELECGVARMASESNNDAAVVGGSAGCWGRFRSNSKRTRF